MYVIGSLISSVVFQAGLTDNRNLAKSRFLGLVVVMSVAKCDYNNVTTFYATNSGFLQIK